MHALLLDIEGTTTPIRFVYDVLFPYARKHLSSYINRHISDPQFSADLRLLQEEYENDRREGLAPPNGDPVQYSLWLMDHDRKSTGLKSIQGKVWAAGYHTGELKGEVFPDVPPALKTWFGQDIDVRIFSSGSVLAQKLLFGNTGAGDLTFFLRGYFDTTTGSKTSSESYKSIALEMGRKPNEIVFVSDVVSELDAAHRAGMGVVLCVRPGNAAQPEHSYESIRSFEEISRGLRG